jgi:hypothetical protein
MYRLREYFEVVSDLAHSDTVVFQLRRPISEELLFEPYSIASFSPGEIDDAFEHSLAFVSPAKQPEVAAAKVMALIAIGDYEQARKELGQWAVDESRAYASLVTVERLLTERTA